MNFNRLWEGTDLLDQHAQTVGGDKETVRAMGLWAESLIVTHVDFQEELLLVH